jgi:Cu2+-exporting ATPase
MPTPPACYHCGLPVDSSDRFSLNQGDKRLLFCCPGCRAVAQTILASGLGKYYDYRSEPANQADVEEQAIDFTLYDREEFQKGFVTRDSSQQQTATLNVQGITCAACTWLIENRLENIDGVDNIHVNLAKHRASICWNPQKLKLSEIFAAIETIGYSPSPYSPDHEEQLLEAEQRLATRRLGVAGIGMMQVGMYAIALHAGAMEGIEESHRDFLRIFSLIISTAVVFYSARPFFEAAWRNLKNRSLGMDVPVSVAIGLAYSASCYATFTGGSDVYFDSVAMFTFFLLASRFLEMRARQRNHLLSQGIAALRPRFAWRVTDMHQAEQIPVDELRIDDEIVVKAGEIMPADGIVLEGESSVDESAFSGEYLPVDKGPNDPVTAGSINADGLLRVRVTAIAEDTRLALITRLLERAQQDKPKTAQLADRLASIFVATVLLCAGGAFLWWYQVAPERALWIALSVLVVSCPCALSLATPTTLTAALATLKSRGVLLSRSNMLEQLPRATIFAFDKTGTLTGGHLALIETRLLGDQPEPHCIAIAAALESYSNHPIASAFRDLPCSLTVDRPQVLSGKGVSGFIGGQEYRIGSWNFAGSDDQEQPRLMAGDNPLVYLSCNRELLAAFIFDDPLRSSAAGTLQSLRQRGYKTVILSGDSSPAVPAAAAATGIEEYYAGLSPEEKLEKIQLWQLQGHRVVMVGDGINDVPVLAAADMSVAMVNASELAKASADCLLLTGDLSRLLTTLDVASKTRRIIIQNLAWSLSYNTAAIPLAAAGLIAPWLAAVGMSSSSLIVVANALRLNRVR